MSVDQSPSAAQTDFDVASANASALRGSLFSAFVATLNADGMPYCCLSGYDPKPAEAGGDIDFMVLPRDLRRVPRLLHKAANSVGASLVQQIPHETTATYFVIARPIGAGVLYLHPDCCTDYRTHRRLWLHAEEVLKHRRPFANFFLPAIEDEFIYYLIKKAIKGEIHLPHIARLRNLYCANPFTCREKALQFWCGNSATQIEKALLHQDLPWFRTNLPSLRTELLATESKERVAGRLINSVGDLVRTVRRIRHRTGMTVAVSEGDHQQRAELTAALANNLSPAFRRFAIVDSGGPSSPETGSRRLRVPPTAHANHLPTRNSLLGLRLQIALLRSTLLIVTDSNGEGAGICCSRAARLPLWPRPDITLILGSAPSRNSATDGARRKATPALRGPATVILDPRLPLEDKLRQTTEAIPRWLSQRLAERSRPAHLLRAVSDSSANPAGDAAVISMETD